MRLFCLPLFSVFSTLIAADLAGAADVRAAVGLQVNIDDLDDANRVNLRRQQVDLGANQVGDFERLPRAAAE